MTLLCKAVQMTKPSDFRSGPDSLSDLCRNISGKYTKTTEKITENLRHPGWQRFQLNKILTCLTEYSKFVFERATAKLIMNVISNYENKRNSESPGLLDRPARHRQTDVRARYERY